MQREVVVVVREDMRFVCLRLRDNQRQGEGERPNGCRGQEDGG